MLRELLRYVNCYEYQVYGYEADDLLYTFAKKYKKKNVLLVSGDKDLLQTLNYCDVLHSNNKNQMIVYDKASFKSEYKISPDDFKYIKAMAGDNSDNIKGWNRVGIITAIKIFKKCKSNIEKVKKICSKEELEMFNLNMKLVTLKHCNAIRNPRTEGNTKLLKQMLSVLKMQHFLKPGNLEVILKLGKA